MPPFFPAPPVLAAPTAASPVPARRFVGGPAARRDVGELSAPEGAGRLWERVEAFRGNRRALERWMAEAYAHADGRPFTADDLDRALAANGLSERFRARQAENVRFLFGFHRGARGKVEQALFLTAEELDALVERLGLRAEVEAMRDFHRSAVLARMGVGDRLRLVLTREKYLADLGILDAVDRELEAYARERFERQAASAPAASAVEERVRREMGLDPEAMRRLMRRYRMVGFARSLLAASAAPARPMPAMR